MARNTTHRSSAIDGRTTRHPGYALSQQKRKRVEQSLGWMKMIGMLWKVKLRGREKVGWLFTFVGAAYNLVRCSDCKPQRRWHEGTAAERPRKAASGPPNGIPPLARQQFTLALTCCEFKMEKKNIVKSLFSTNCYCLRLAGVHRSCAPLLALLS